MQNRLGYRDTGETGGFLALNNPVHVLDTRTFQGHVSVDIIARGYSSATVDNGRAR